LNIGKERICRLFLEIVFCLSEKLALLQI